MPKKKKPKYRWGFTRGTLESAEGRKINREEILERAGKVPADAGLYLSDDQHQIFIKTCDNFIADKTQFANPPNKGEIKEAARELQEKAKDFAECLSNLDHHTRRKLRLLRAEAGHDSSERFLMDLKEQAGILAGQAKDLDAKIEPHTQGRPPRARDKAEQMLIGSLADIYEQATEKKATAYFSAHNKITDFQRLVDKTLEALQPLADPQPEANTLAKTIQRALQENA